ncbi:MAG: L-histidine N(alpha)-methyltransferase [Vulcanimicrobiaceae bacterium]
MIAGLRDDGYRRIGARLMLYRARPHAEDGRFAADVRAGLGATPKRLSPTYFYDELGSALFEAICALPEYYLTRAESEILARHADEIVGALGEPLELVEFGSGSARKTRVLIEAALARQERLAYHPIDISEEALIGSAGALLAAYEQLEISAFASDYREVLAGGLLRTQTRVLALFLGSNIGNFEPDAARTFLTSVAGALRRGDGLLLGYDLKKEASILERAYDDPGGVTAAFNKNLLGRINRELGGGFDARSFEHSARYDPQRGGVDSFLVSSRAQRVPVAALACEIAFAAGEAIHTESSFKFDPDAIAKLARRSGFSPARTWFDPERRFAVALLLRV